MTSRRRSPSAPSPTRPPPSAPSPTPRPAADAPLPSRSRRSRPPRPRRPPRRRLWDGRPCATTGRTRWRRAPPRPRGETTLRLTMSRSAWMAPPTKGRWTSRCIPATRISPWHFRRCLAASALVKALCANHQPRTGLLVVRMLIPSKTKSTSSHTKIRTLTGCFSVIFHGTCLPQSAGN